MDEGIGIRPAALHDVDAIHRIEELYFPSAWRREFFSSEVNADGRFNLVAERGGAIIGYLFAMWIFEEMHINKIAVIESERRRGVAATLMAHCFTFAREHAVESISLEVRESNRSAQDFYRSLDFGVSHVRPRYYPDGEPAVVMVRRL